MWVLPIQGSIYHIRGEYANHYTIDAVYWKKNKKTWYVQLWNGTSWFFCYEFYMVEMTMVSFRVTESETERGCCQYVNSV